ncbi:hypothetical protein L6R53_26070 [Myxococcota bacterium]|nr:hypothetical protein [Myxococcota bacterium]
MPAVSSFMISVRNDLGVAVGHAEQLSADHVAFWMNVPLERGSKVEFRLELPGADETVLGFLVIEAGEGPPGTLVHYRARVAEIDPGDRDCFHRWVQAVSEGHVPLNVRGAALTGNPFSTMHGASREQTEAALRRIEERKERMARATQRFTEQDTDEVFIAGVFDLGAPAPAPARAAASPPPATRPGAAATAATDPRLRQGTGARLPSADWWQGPHPAQHHRSEDAAARARLLRQLLDEGEGRSAAPPPAPPSATPPTPPPAPSPPAAHRGPWVTLRDARGHQELTVAWMDHASLVEGPLEALLSGMLRLRRERLPQWPARTEVHLVTPGGHDIVAHAELVEETGSAVVYHLELSPAAHHLLVEEAHQH